MAPRIEADLEQAQGRQVLPDNTWHHMMIAGLPEVKKSKGNDQTGARPGNPFAAMNLEVTDGDYKGVRVFGYNLMLGGIDKNGNSMNISRFVEFLDCLAADGVSWECGGCGAQGDRRFRIGDKGTKDAGRYFCPDCGESKRFVTNTDDWQGHRMNVLVKVGKFFNSDEDRNEVVRVTPYGEIVVSEAV